MSLPNKFGTFVLAALVLACGAASAEQVVVGYRTYMSSFPFYGC